MKTITFGYKCNASPNAGECAGDWNHEHFIVFDADGIGEGHRNTMAPDKLLSNTVCKDLAEKLSQAAQLRREVAFKLGLAPTR